VLAATIEWLVFEFNSLSKVKALVLSSRSVARAAFSAQLERSATELVATAE
jgi:hypothetical protein